jgi:transcriptional regulator with XRE-family HTH domain
MTPDETAFFRAFGARIAQCRKDADLTQVQLAEAVGIGQPQLASYEVGRRRLPLSLLSQLARALAVTVEDLIGGEDGRPAGKRGPASRLQHQMERIQRLPRAQQRFVMQMLDTVLQQAAR